MTLANPDLLYAGLAVALLLAGGLWRQARRRRRLADFLGGGRAVSRLSSWNLYRWRPERWLLLGGAAGLLALAAAGPLWLQPEPAPPPPPVVRSVVLALDVSASMQARDVAPNRLGRAVEVAREILATLPEERVGLLLFAGEPYVLAPPTHDHRVISFFLDGVTPTIASSHDPGSRLTAGLDEAARLLASDTAAASRSIVLISDGEAGEGNAAMTAAVDRMVAAGVTIHTVGVGTERGGPMEMPAGEFQLGGPVMGANGGRAVTRLRPPPLRQAAERSGGTYAFASDAAQVASLVRALSPPVAENAPEAPPPPWADRDPATWLVVAALVGLLLESLLDARLPRLRAAARRRSVA